VFNFSKWFSFISSSTSSGRWFFGVPHLNLVKFSSSRSCNG
jgi:hypothetical protein